MRTYKIFHNEEPHIEPIILEKTTNKRGEVNHFSVKPVNSSGYRDYFEIAYGTPYEALEQVDALIKVLVDIKNEIQLDIK